MTTDRTMLETTRSQLGQILQQIDRHLAMPGPPAVAPAPIVLVRTQSVGDIPLERVGSYIDLIGTKGTPDLWSPDTGVLSPTGVVEACKELDFADERPTVILNFEGALWEALESDDEEHAQTVFGSIGRTAQSLRIHGFNRIGFYGLPRLRFWQGKPKKPYPGDSLLITRWEQRVMDIMDVLCPSFYDWVDDDMLAQRFSVNAAQEQRAAWHRWQADVIRHAGEKPVIPLVCARYVFRGKQSDGAAGRYIDGDEFFVDQVAIARSHGVKQFALWDGEDDWRIDQFARLPKSHQDWSIAQNYVKAAQPESVIPADLTRAHRAKTTEYANLIIERVRHG